MRQNKKIGVVIPAHNEEAAIAKVIGDTPEWIDRIVVADNRSEDRTVEIAEAAGAEVVHVTSGGYGAACLAGIAEHERVGVDIMVFVDGDYSDYPQQMDMLVDPIVSGQADLVIGSRKLGHSASGALTPQQKFGNRLACFLIRLFWNVTYTDLGPFRAISLPALQKLNMDDSAFGWTVQMQLRAIQESLNVREVPVDYRVRIGQSKISGTLKGTILAGHAIIGTILKTAIFDRRR